MRNGLNLYYDEEGDFPELNVGNYTKGYFKNPGNGVFEKVDKKTKKTTGIAIHAFRKRTRSLKDVKVSLPIKIQLSS
jgi:hypothetical protein